MARHLSYVTQIVIFTNSCSFMIRWRNYQSLDEIDFGSYVKVEMKALPSSTSAIVIKLFRTRCFNFYLELMKQLYKRFPFERREIQLLEEVGFVEPINLKSIKSIALTADFFNLNIRVVDAEYRQFRREFKDTTQSDPTEFWGKVRSLKKEDGSLEYQNVLNTLWI